MAPKVEFEGKSVDAAVEKACKELNLKKEQIKYDVLSYGATGIFGIVGAKKARIRIKGPRGKKASKMPGEERPLTKEPLPAPDEPPEEPEIVEVEDPIQEAEGVEEEEGDSEEERLSLAELEAAATKGEEVLERILAAICDETQIVAELSADRIHFDVKGGNPAVLIGKRGQTLEAVQYLVDKMVNQQLQRRIRIVVDVEGYWENRRNSLQEMAKRMAEKSKQSGKPITLGQMNAQDRRIVHLTLKDDPSVKTQSRGEGFFRKLVIFPRKTAQRKPRQGSE
ncbi:MAG: RNA-binding cell elongation regulator Jag/EloR [Desulfobacterales bacterium]|jgi:spoIIIJ-associated protein